MDSELISGCGPARRKEPDTWLHARVSDVLLNGGGVSLHNYKFIEALSVDPFRFSARMSLELMRGKAC